jgi:hypothetical protein
MSDQANVIHCGNLRPQKLRKNQQAEAATADTVDQGETAEEDDSTLSDESDTVIGRSREGSANGEGSKLASEGGHAGPKRDFVINNQSSKIRVRSSSIQ